jgi:hypothetical protein
MPNVDIYQCGCDFSSSPLPHPLTMATPTIYIPQLHYLTVVLKENPLCDLKEAVELFQNLFSMNHSRAMLKRIARVNWKKLDWVLM